MMAAPIMLKRALHLLALLLLLWTLGLSGTGYAQTRALAEPAADAARVPPPDEEPYNGGYFADQSVPTTMTAGAVYTVTVRMVNNGTKTWSSSTSHALGSQNPQDNGTWGGGRVGLAGNVLPGRSATFTFQVTAPANPGSYNFQWKMVQDGVEWFGGPSDNVVINVVAAPRINDAVFVGQSVPANMTAGTAYAVSVSMYNSGNTTWTTSDPYALGSFNPENNGVWGTARGWLAASVGPGQTGTFTFTVTAPSIAGSYGFQWRMLQSSCCWFGAASTNVVVNVSPPAPVNNAQIIGIQVPPLTQGQNATMYVAVQNTGNTTWPAGSNYKLGSQNPGENLIWGVQRVDLANDVAPGQSYTFAFPITAPASGTYTMQWQMMQRYVEWFGGLASTSVTVGAPAGDTVTYIHTDALGSPVARSDSAGNVISRTSYEPYGRTASGVTPTIGFTGHVNDADTGLVYMQQRYYDPVAGRFLSVDPVTTDANSGSSFNRFAYASNSPYKYVDPDGRAPDEREPDKRDKQIEEQLRKERERFNPIGWTPSVTPPPSLADVNRTPTQQSFLESSIDILSEIAYRAQGIPGEGFVFGAIGAVGKMGGSGTTALNFSKAAAGHMDNAGRAVPVQILAQAIKSSPGLADPRGSRALMHTVEMWKNGKVYQLEVLYDKLTNSIWHFQYEQVRK